MQHRPRAAVPQGQCSDQKHHPTGHKTVISSQNKRQERGRSGFHDPCKSRRAAQSDAANCRTPRRFVACTVGEPLPRVHCMSSVPRLRECRLGRLTCLDSRGVGLRAVGKLLHHPGAALAADGWSSLALLIPAPAIAQLSTRLRAGVIARSPWLSSQRSRWASADSRLRSRLIWNAQRPLRTAHVAPRTRALATGCFFTSVVG